MITNYIKPQLLIRQLLEVLPNVQEPSLNAFVYGPQYKLNRYYEVEERATMNGIAFQSRGEEDPRLVVPYENVNHNKNVEIDGVRLFAEDMELSYAVVDSTLGEMEESPNAFFWTKPSRPNEIILRNQAGAPEGDNEVNLYDTNSDLAIELDGRPVKIGDLVIVTENILAGEQDKVHRRRIMDVKRSSEASSIGDLFCGPKNLEDSTAETDVITEAVNGISSMSDITITVDQASVDTSAEMHKHGSNYGKLLKEKFNVRFTKGCEDGVDGECKVRTVSNNFEENDIIVTWDSGAASFLIASAGVGVSVDATKILPGDSFDFTVTSDYTKFDCVSGVGPDTFSASMVGQYLHREDTTILTSCIEGDENGIESVWNISDTAGVEDVMEVTGAELASGVSFGASGTTITLTKTEHVKGEEFGFECIAAGETGTYSVLVLDAPVGDLELIDEDELYGTAITKVEIRGTYAGEIGRRGLNAPREQWTAKEDGIQLEADLAYVCYGFGNDQSESRLCKFVSENAITPRLFASYRELVPANPDEKIHRVRNAHDLSKFGKKDIENPLGFGAGAAYSGSQGKDIYVARLETNDLAGYIEILRKAENIDALYSHAPLTDDLDVQLEVRAHVDSMSNEYNKKWRRAYISTPVPGDYRVIGGPGGQPATGTISPSEDGNVVVNDPEGSFVSSNVKHGDLFRINFTSNVWGDPVYNNFEDGGYVVHRVLDNETLILKSGPAKSINVPRRYEVWKKDTAENIADFASARSSSIGSRRMNNIFCEGAQYLTDDDEFVSLHPMYLAAEIAGLRSAVLPQQGLTNTEIALVASAPAMYIRYTQDQLNQIAANGSFIIAQEYEDGPRFVRHQLTTKTDKGNLYYEDSVGVNLDEISFVVKGKLRPYIGRRNVNPQTVRDIFRDVFKILSAKTADPGFGNSIGPALIGFTDLIVKINDTFKDRIDVSAKLEIPLPLNVIDVTLHATASFNQGEITLESLGIRRVGSTTDQMVDELKATLTSDGAPIQASYDQ